MAKKQVSKQQYTAVVGPLVDKYQQLMEAHTTKQAAGQYAEALLLKIEADDIADQLQHAYKRGTGFYNE